VTFVGYTRRTIPADIPVIAANMRAVDAAEVQAQSGSSPQEALLYCFLYSKPCMTICKADETPIAMWGVVPETPSIGRVWMLGTDELVQNRAVQLRFLREVRAYLKELFKTYAVLWNCVDMRNTVHVRWIGWMGFTFVAKHPNYGAEGRPFLEFCQVSKSCVTP